MRGEYEGSIYELLDQLPLTWDMLACNAMEVHGCPDEPTQLGLTILEELRYRDGAATVSDASTSGIDIESDIQRVRLGWDGHYESERPREWFAYVERL